MSDLIKQNQAPAYLAEMTNDIGIDDIKSYIRPKFLKVVQPIGSLAEEFDKGTVIRMPDKEVLLEPGGTALVTPIFLWKEWGEWYDLKANSPNPVRRRTLDKNDPMVELARKQIRVPDPDHPGLELSYNESINFILYLHEREELVCATFTRGEHKTGRQLAELIALRNVPIYAGIYEMTVGVHKSRDQKKAWQGLNFNNYGYVDKETFDKFKPHFEVYKRSVDRIEVVAPADDDDSKDEF